MAQRTKPRNPLFGGRWFEDEIIILCLRWYFRCELSYRDLVEMMAERGLLIAHTTILRCALEDVTRMTDLLRADEWIDPLPHLSHMLAVVTQVQEDRFVQPSELQVNDALCLVHLRGVKCVSKAFKRVCFAGIIRADQNSDGALAFVRNRAQN